MSRDQDQNLAPLHSVEQLVEYFEQGSKTGELGIGTEHEKFVFRGADLAMVPFDGAGGIEELLEHTAERYGWERAPDRGRTVALVRGGEAVTLEPAGQLELSGAVTKTIFETAREFDRHLAETAAVAGPDYKSVSFGLNPWDDLFSVELMPKARYAVMNAYLHTRGDLARWMMQGTCTIQANLDYTSEADAVSLVRASILASPFVNALFANSPIRLGKPTGMQSFRAHIWTRTDPDRCGVPDFLYRDDWGFEDWANWVIDVPMFFIRRDDGYVDLAGVPFRELYEGRVEGYEATMGDFELHLSTVFPEVRLKRFVETRSADGGPREFVFALPALWKGIGYSASARAKVLDLFAGIDASTHFAAFDLAARDGIHGTFAGRPMLEWCRDIVTIAAEGLTELAGAEGDERSFLDPLVEVLESRSSLADRLLRDFEAHGGDRAAIIGPRDLFALPRR